MLSGKETAVSLVYPTTSAELVGMLSHYYRGEMARMTSWRDRIDRTTNWAIAGVAAMLSVSLSSSNSHHSVLLFAMLLVYLLLYIESRRYRFFDVYRTRVRLIERHYYAAVFSPGEQMDRDPWLARLAEGLRRPSFSISFKQAMARRLRRNYIWIYLILLLAWLAKTSSAMLQFPGTASEFIHSTSMLLGNASVGGIPGWFVAVAVLLFYAWLFFVMFKHQTVKGELSYGEVHV